MENNKNLNLYIENKDNFLNNSNLKNDSISCN